MYDVKAVTTEHQTACGAASLKMLLDYYGKSVTLYELIAECGVKITGCTGKDIMVTGNKHGLDLHSWRMDAEALLIQDRPAIIWWRHRHWVVFCGLNDAGEPVIANPSSGRYAIPVSTFNERYSEIAIFNGRPDDLIPEDYWGENSETPEYFDYDEEAQA